MLSDSTIAETTLFAGASQPLRRDFGISTITIDGESVPVVTRDLVATDFYCLLELSTELPTDAEVLVIPPLSGHFPILLRDLIAGLLPAARVYVADWLNVRHVPADRGGFGLKKNIGAVLDMVRSLEPGLNLLALCQAGPPALAATAILSSGQDPHTPAGLVLMASPIDPLANPTGVVSSLRAQPISWFADRLISTVPEEFAGCGRLVYAAHEQLMRLSIYLVRRMNQGGEITAKLLFDDGLDPRHYPFLDLYTSIMDLDATFFLENIKSIFQDLFLREGGFRYQGDRFELKEIKRTALLTLEGEFDDIAAPGQTSAAHDMCRSLPSALRGARVFSGLGHFSLFHGASCRERVLPEIHSFIRSPATYC